MKTYDIVQLVCTGLYFLRIMHMSMTSQARWSTSFSLLADVYKSFICALRNQNMFVWDLKVVLDYIKADWGWSDKEISFNLRILLAITTSLRQPVCIALTSGTW